MQARRAYQRFLAGEDFIGLGFQNLGNVPQDKLALFVHNLAGVSICHAMPRTLDAILQKRFRATSV